MKTKYNDFINESDEPQEFIFDEEKLKSKIVPMGYWLIDSNGLNLHKVIDKALDEYKDFIDSDEINNFKKGLDKLSKTNYPINKNYLSSLINNIDGRKNIKVGNKWHLVNKLNTNYSDQTDLLIDLLRRMTIDENLSIKNDSIRIYKNIIINPKEALLNIKDRIPGMINYYYKKNGKGLEEFLEFTKNTRKNSEKGLNAENITVKYLSGLGFNLDFQGGDGDFIDMLFGCDLIMSREDFGFKSIQVKAFDIPQYKAQKYKTDWLSSVVNNGIPVIKNIKEWSMIDIKPLEKD